MTDQELLARAVAAETDWYRTGPDFEIDFIRLRAHIVLALQAERDRMKEECASYLETRATELQDNSSYASQWVARIFKDEAACIRELP